MLNFIDSLLNKITMYRLVLYYLCFLLLGALVLCFFGLLPYSPWALLFSASVLVAVCWLANEVFAWFLGVQTNVESVYITALILALIISPPTGSYLVVLPFLFWASVLAMASKYILNIKNKHIFNPAAFAVALTAYTINHSASWWVGTSSMLALVFLGGFLVVRKVQRFQVAIAFLAAAFLAVIIPSLDSSNFVLILKQSLFDSPLIFFASIMLTEPLTMPPTRDGRLAYAILVGWLIAPQVHFGSFYFTPEMALLAGNVFTYAISPKGRLVLKLKEKNIIGSSIYDFVFSSPRPLIFRPGQYMEWTLGHKHTDSRGNRRYFTLASSPTERDVLLGVKFYDKPSSFKKNLLSMQVGDEIVAAQLAGEFVLPKDKTEKLVFVAGGIGVTPFRSMLKYLLDQNEKRSITVLYSCKSEDELAYEDIMQQANEKLGVKVVCTLTERAPEGWPGYRGFITPQLIAKEVPDYLNRTFYISGSHSMVTAFKENLAKLGIARRKIITDFFPGLA